jgi:hypothetical protein
MNWRSKLLTVLRNPLVAELVVAVLVVLTRAVAARPKKT